MMAHSESSGIGFYDPVATEFKSIKSSTQKNVASKDYAWNYFCFRLKNSLNLIDNV